MSTAVKLSTLTHPALEKLVVEHISSGIKDTVSQLGNFNSVFKPHFFAQNWVSPAKVTVILDFKQADQPLQARMHFDPKPIAAMLQNMLGDKVDPESPEVLDGVGEISNMIFGLIKTKANSGGFSFGMGTPKAYFSKDAPGQIKNHQSLVIPFAINSLECFFEFVAYE